ncbi:MAG: PPOX class F420-dependent oxidoreductase [Chloroflexi bacterium]|nr:PPOX class F420-dependent oxidoreductase [Chloroflexota bacterium]
MELQAPQIREFLSHPYLAKLATINRDGSPHLTYVWFELNGNALLVPTTKDRVKTKNIERDPRATIAIDNPDNAWQWVIVGGRVSVVTEGAHDLIERLALKYMGPERGTAYGRQTKSEPRITLRIEPQKLRTMGF